MIFLIQAITITVVQLLFVQLYTLPMARFQEPIIKGMRNYWPQQNLFTEPFHRFGWQLAFCFGFLLALFHVGVILVCYTRGMCSVYMLLSCTCTPVLCGLWHWKVFDEAIGSKVYNNRFYLGSTKTDAWLRKKYGQDAGEKKDRLTIEGIVCINALFIISNILISWLTH